MGARWSNDALRAMSERVPQMLRGRYAQIRFLNVGGPDANGDQAAPGSPSAAITCKTRGRTCNAPGASSCAVLNSVLVTRRQQAPPIPEWVTRPERLAGDLPPSIGQSGLAAA